MLSIRLHNSCLSHASGQSALPPGSLKLDFETKALYGTMDLLDWNAQREKYGPPAVSIPLNGQENPGTSLHSASGPGCRPIEPSIRRKAFFTFAMNQLHKSTLRSQIAHAVKATNSFLS